ncbi:hypothetical protein Ddye_008661, partial [Dipteronia dyeriana]
CSEWLILVWDAEVSLYRRGLGAMTVIVCILLFRSMDYCLIMSGSYTEIVCIIGLHLSFIFQFPGAYLGKHSKLKPMASEFAVWCSGKKLSVPVYETPIGKIGGPHRLGRKLFNLSFNPCVSIYVGIKIYCVSTAETTQVWQASMNHIAIEGSKLIMHTKTICLIQCVPGDPIDDTLSTTTIRTGDLEEIAPAKLEFGGVGIILGEGRQTKKPNPVLFSTSVKTEIVDDLQW